VQEVAVGPVSFVTSSHFNFAKGDRVIVTGAKMKMGGSDVVVAREIKKGDQVLTLRDAKGVPLWSPASRDAQKRRHERWATRRSATKLLTRRNWLGAGLVVIGPSSGRAYRTSDAARVSGPCASCTASSCVRRSDVHARPRLV
jgi:hypothetical protein